MDSWGSDLSETELAKGVSLILYRTAKGQKLIRSAELELLDVDLEKAVEANRQLNSPSQKPDKRELFLSLVSLGFHRAAARCFPKVYYRQELKAILTRMKVIGG